MGDQTDDWRPIGTAPKDGRFVLIANSADFIKAKYGEYGWEGCYVPVGHEGDCVRLDGDPTHWMPCPELPAATEKNWLVEVSVRWVKCSHRSSDLYAGGIYLGYVEASIDGSWKAWARTGSVPAWFGDFATEAFAKAAVVKTMVDRLTKKETK